MSGIGRGIALGFAADGADVVASSRTESSVADTAAELRDLGAETAEFTCDVTDRPSLKRLRDGVVDELGGVDVLVNSPTEIHVNAVRPGFIVSEQTSGTYTEGEPRHDTIVERTVDGRLGCPRRSPAPSSTSPATPRATRPAR